MSSHKHAPWRKSVLIPCWVVQLGLMLLTVASAVLALKLTNDRYYYDSSGDYVVEKNVINMYAPLALPPLPIYQGPFANKYQSVAAVLLAITVVCIALTIAEIIQLARRKLSPKVFVIMNTIKSTFQTVMFVISIASVASRDSVAVGLLSLLIQGVLLCVSIFTFFLMLKHISNIFIQASFSRSAHLRRCNLPSCTKGSRYSIHRRRPC